MLVSILMSFVQGTFLPLVISPKVFQAGLWSIWLIVICSLKMFQALARDRLERLNASPSATPWAYFRVFSVFLFVLSFNLFWIWLSFVLYKTLNLSMFLLLFFEPLSIAFETMQAILVHGFQLLEISPHSVGNSADCQRAKLFDLSAAGSFWEWKGILIHNLGFFLDVAILLMALGHYVLIWWLHGMAFHLVDAVLFLNIRRVKGFIKLRMALGALHAALLDATSEEIRAYGDECAICREPMAKAKKLHCNHLFHLACLRSWLDQGLNEVYSCPTCRKPLFLGRTKNEANSRTREALTHQINSLLDRSAGLDSGWLRSLPNQSVDGAGPSTVHEQILGLVYANLIEVLESVKHLNKDDPISVGEERSSGDGIIFHESHAVKPKDSDSLLREMKQNREISAVSVPIKPLVSFSGRVPSKNLDERTANFKPSTHVGLLRETSIEVNNLLGSRRLALSIVVVEHEFEHGSQSHVKQDRDPYKTHHDQLEDASVTDYDPPHQKPPIHNRQT
ncbi:hypothetical protein CRYUN_Cryun07bG0004800 [Craigia yunnanensis]